VGERGEVKEVVAMEVDSEADLVEEKAVEKVAVMEVQG